MSPSVRCMSSNNTKANITMTASALTIFLFQNISFDFLIDEITTIAGVVLPVGKNTRYS